MKDQYPYGYERLFLDSSEWVPHGAVQEWLRQYKECSDHIENGEQPAVREATTTEEFEDFQDFQNYFTVSNPRWFRKTLYGFHSWYDGWKWASDPIIRNASEECVRKWEKKPDEELIGGLDLRGTGMRSLRHFAEPGMYSPPGSLELT